MTGSDSPTASLGCGGRRDELLLADAHDRQALLYDRLAADTVGLLYLGFLHAAEAHRVAARISRSSAGAIDA